MVLRREAGNGASAKDFGERCPRETTGTSAGTYRRSPPPRQSPTRPGYFDLGCVVPGQGLCGAGWVYDLSRGRGGPVVEVEQVESPRVCRRLRLLGRMGSCREDLGATRRSCGTVLFGWWRRFGRSMLRSG